MQIQRHAPWTAAAKGRGFRVFLAVGFLLAGFGRAESLTNLVSAVDREAVDDGSRIALLQATHWFRQRATADDQGWLVPPVRQRTVVETKDVTFRYRLETYDVDEPIYEYETHTTYVQTVPYEPPRKMEVRRPVRITGTHRVQRQREVPDANGPLSRVYKQPVYGPGGPDSWSVTALGENGLAIYALRQAGMPADDPILMRVSENLLTFFDCYGMPDHTWSLAWLTAGFATLPGDRCAQTTRRLAERLLDGQITEGAARGLWGPMCVNTRVLAPLLRRLADGLEEVNRRKVKEKEKPSANTTRSREAAESEVTDTVATIRRVSQQAIRLARIEEPFAIPASQSEAVTLAGASHFFFNQTVVDLENTWTALAGLAVAARLGRLPEETWRPERKGTAAAYAIPFPEKTSAIVARAVNAVAKLQLRDGTWNEANLHQPVKDFDAIKDVLPGPVDPRSFPALPSPVTPFSTACGLGALTAVGQIVGPDRVLATFRPNVLLGLRARRRDLEGLLHTPESDPAAKTVRNGPDLAPFVGESRSGGQIPPFELLLSCAAPPPTTDSSLTDEAASTLLARNLLLTRNADGSWGRGRAFYEASSSRARGAALTELGRILHSANTLVDFTKAHVFRHYLVDAKQLNHYHQFVLMDAPASATAAAMVFLAGRLPLSDVQVTTVEQGPELDALWKDLAARISGRRPPPPKPVPAPPPPAAEVITPPVDATLPAPAPEPEPEPPKLQADEVL